MKRFIIRAILKEIDTSNGKCFKPHLELYDEDYYWKHIAPSEGVTFIATVQVEDDNITYFDPDGDLTPDDALLWGDDEDPQPVVTKKKYMEEMNR